MDQRCGISPRDALSYYCCIVRFIQLQIYPLLSWELSQHSDKFKLKFAKIDAEGDIEIDTRSSLGKNILSETLY